MTLDNFLSKWRISLSSDARSLCDQAWQILLVSKDPAHDHHHVMAHLRNVDHLLESENELSSQVNFEVLIVSIFWHDVWKSTFIPTNIFSLFFSFVWDGMGSAQMFSRAAGRFNFNKKKKSKIFYAIRKHHSAQFLPRRTLESKILKDCDELELWSLSRAKKMYSYALHYMNSLGMRRLLKMYLHHKVQSSEQTVYFETTAQLLKKRMSVVMQDFDDELEAF